MGIFRYRYFLRPKRCIIGTTILISTFLLYQLLSVRELGHELSKRSSKSRLQTNFQKYEKADGFMQKKKSNKEAPPDQPEVESLKSFVIGVPSSSQDMYRPTVRNTFRCLRSGEEINYSFLNDNYCDCSDFSDEPSTSACNFGKFYCTHQSKHHVNSILSYKVNDGVCDCCDGSDEWMHIKPPEHSQVSAIKQKGIYQVPCPVKCIS